ncbi:MAG: two-component sensor histidine kinase, partial [Bacteroidaceae bacterium]
MENSTITNEELQAKVKNLETQLKKQEKMASLGMLSAGIAHELQNPLNFVINFSKISIQLIADLQDAIDNLRVSISAEEASDIKEMMGDIHENMNKIIENGNRATSIIRGILLSSRGKEDEFIPTDIS